ncbi:MAG: hypothetical protein N2512_05185, partial [Armatimonadetes bacterium]|nr:hypothetical protein [Armatimonadota bacterium]
MTPDAATVAAWWKQVKKRLGRRGVLEWVVRELGKQVAESLAEVVNLFLQWRVEELLRRRRWG